MSAPTSIPYLEETDDELPIKASKAFSVTFDPSRENVQVIVLTGPCPKCEHDMEYRDDIWGILEARKTLPLPREFPVMCQCGMNHENAPEGKIGCGRYWRMNVG